jgi:SAM-dependent methyltransferase
MSTPKLTITAWLRFASIRRALAIAGPRSVMEVGAGEGALGSWLATRCDYVGIEPDSESRRVAVSRLRALGRGQMRSDLPAIDDRAYDLVCAFEVLEHIEDDRKALAAWTARLAPRGFLLLSVPAHSDRFGPSDGYVGHFRRYDRAPLAERLDAEGFEILLWRSYGAGLGHFLDGVRNAVLGRRAASPSAEERTAGSGRLFQPRSRARSFFNYIVALPFRALQAPFGRTEVGIGYVVLARLRR